MPDTPVPLDFGLSSDTGRHGIDGGPWHENCYVEPVKEGSKGPGVLRASDGCTLWAQIPSTGAIRGMRPAGDGYLYVVSGTQLFKVDVNGGLATTIGGVPGTGKVVMAANDITAPQIVIITDEGEVYICQSDAITAHPDNDLPAPTFCTYLNQRILYGITDGRVFFSAVDDAADIDPLDTFTAEGFPDGLVAVVSHMQEAWCFGRNSLEIWRDTGDASTPFRRSDVGVVPRGCINKHTVKSMDLDLFWVGDDRKVYRARGYQVEAIAPAGVLDDLRQTAATDIEAQTLHAWGHDFYILSGPTWTWAFNRTTGAWDPRKTYGQDRWFGAEAVLYDGMTIFGDHDGPNLYKLDRDAHDEAGTKLVWRARTAPMHAYPSQISVDRVHLDFVTGVGLNSTSAHESNPQVGLRWSDDGGAVWSRQLFKPLGTIGKRQTRVSFEGLGTTSPTGRIWEVEVSAPVVRALMTSAVEGEVNGV